MAILSLRRGISFSLLYSLLTFSCLAKQPIPGDWQQVLNLNPGTDVAVQTKAGGRYHGHLLSVSPDSMALESDERGHPGRTRLRRELPRDEVRKVRLLHTGVSMLAGAGIGAAVGVGIGLAVESSARSNEDGHLVSAVFALLGGAVGAGIGRHFPIGKGKTVYLAQ